MKKLFAFFSVVLVLLSVLLFAPLVDAKAKKAKKVKEFGFENAKQIVAVIADVNTTENFVLIREGKGANKKVLMNGAVVVKVTESSTQVATLLDVVKGQKAHLWVNKKPLKKAYQGFVLTQFLGNKALDSQPPVAQFAMAGSEGLENATPSLTVSLSKAASKEVKVAYTVSGTATGTGSSTDYTLANGELVIAVGQISGVIPLVVANDSAQESDETVVVTLASATNALLGTQKVHTYTIKDDDQSGVGFGTTTGSGAESATSVQFQVTLSAASLQEVKVDYAVSGIATGGGTDYTLANGTVTIPAGQTTANIMATVVDDSAIESAETIILTLSNPVGATLTNSSVHTYTITDNDLPSIGFGSSTSSGAESVTAVNIPVTLSAASPREARVNYAVTSTTASGGGVDYTLANGTVVIAAGQTSANIALTVVNDTIDEVNETVLVTLSGPTDATLGATSVHTYTIQDNDDPTAQFAAATGSGLESVTPVSIAVNLSVAPVAEVQIPYTVGGTATSGGTDYTLAAGTTTIAVGQTSANISLVIVEDALVDLNETVVITLGTPVNATLGATTVYTYTITDND